MKADLSTAPLTLALVLVAVTALVYQAGGRPSAQQRPITVAKVNLGKALSGLEQRADAEAGLKALADTIIAERKQQEDDVKRMQAELEGMGDTEQRQKREEELALAVLKYEGRRQFQAEKLDLERALLLQDIYRDMTEAIRELAETEGYDLIVVDDSEGEMGWSNESKISREVQVLQQIRGRRVLYGSPAIDVTDNLIARMNNAYRAGSR